MKQKIGIIIGILVIIGLAAITFGVMTAKKNKPVKTDQNQNPPILLEGMRAITLEEGSETPKILEPEEAKEGIWYEYIAQTGETEEGGSSRWANAITQDGSMWVWIPRFAYKIQWDGEEQTGKIDVVFLQGTTNFNQEGQDVTKLGYIVHPAFQDGTGNQFANGEWDKEITGIWVSKFEAGFAGQKNTASENIPVVDTNLTYERDEIGRAHV